MTTSELQQQQQQQQQPGKEEKEVQINSRGLDLATARKASAEAEAIASKRAAAISAAFARFGPPLPAPTGDGNIIVLDDPNITSDARFNAIEHVFSNAALPLPVSTCNDIKDSARPYLYIPGFILPDLSNHVGSLILVHIDRVHVSPTNPAIMRRNLWGTGVYSDDSDVVAMLAHTGWIKIRMGASKRKNLLVILRVLPRLQRYLATLRNGIRSREWSKHDGQSLRVEAVLESTNSELLSVVAKIKKRAKSDKSGANGSSGEDAVDGMDEDWVYGGHGFDEYGRSIYPSGFNPMDYVGHDIRFTDDNIAALIYDPLYFAYPSTKTAKRAEKAESPHATPPAAEDAMDIDSTTDDANENMVLQQLQLGQCLVIQTKEARYFLSIKSGSKLIIVRNESLKTTVSSQAELDAMIESATSTKDITEIEWDDVDWRMDGPYGRALDTRLVLAQSQLVFWCKMIR